MSLQPQVRFNDCSLSRIVDFYDAQPVGGTARNRSRANATCGSNDGRLPPILESAVFCIKTTVGPDRLVGVAVGGCGRRRNEPVTKSGEQARMAEYRAVPWGDASWPSRALRAIRIGFTSAACKAASGAAPTTATSRSTSAMASCVTRPKPSARSRFRPRIPRSSAPVARSPTFGATLTRTIGSPRRRTRARRVPTRVGATRTRRRVSRSIRATRERFMLRWAMFSREIRSAASSWRPNSRKSSGS